MRLINTYTLDFEEFEGLNVPEYVILSHRWEQGEVLYAEIKQDLDFTSKPGWHKIVKCCEQARRDSFSFAWIDTCCIDKSSSAELTEAINSMFKWYEEAKVCYAYLCDVDAFADFDIENRKSEPEHDHRYMRQGFLTQFYESAWFTRGWTLQELLAPRHIEFFNSRWHHLGNKDELRYALTCVTCIPAEALLHERRLSGYTVAQRMSWASKRTTTRVEDLAYSLLGIFNVNMPLLYGEREAAFVRLQEEILRRSDDESILLWEAEDLSLLARSPAAFAIHLPQITNEAMMNARLSTQCPLDIELHCRHRKERSPCTVTNVGLSITLLLIPWYMDVYLVRLQVHKRITAGGRFRSYDACIFLRQTVNDSRLARVQVGREAILYLEAVDKKSHGDDFLRVTGIKPGPYVIAHESWDTSAGDGYLRAWDVKKQRYGLKFTFQQQGIWGRSKTLETVDVICRNKWDEDRTLVLNPGEFEVLGIFRIQGAERWQYLYFGFTPDFIPTIVQKDWHFETSFKPFDDYRVSNPVHGDLAEVLSYSHFWESIKRSDPEQELVIQGSQNPHDIIRARTDVDGLSLMITRWTSGYSLDFMKSPHKKNLVVPADTKRLASNPSASSTIPQLDSGLVSNGSK